VAESYIDYSSIADQISSYLANPAGSIDQTKMAQGRQARLKSLDELGRYAESL
jgi:hypothetical protein